MTPAEFRAAGHPLKQTVQRHEQRAIGERTRFRLQANRIEVGASGRSAFTSATTSGRNEPNTE